MASPVRTLLLNNNSEGKTIISFCTDGGGCASSTYIDIKNLAKRQNLAMAAHHK